MTADCVQCEMKSHKGTCGICYSQHARKYCKCRNVFMWHEKLQGQVRDICSRGYRHRNSILGGEREHTSSYNKPHWWTCHGMMNKAVLFSSSKIGLAKS